MQATVEPEIFFTHLPFRTHVRKIWQANKISFFILFKILKLFNQPFLSHPQILPEYKLLKNKKNNKLNTYCLHTMPKLYKIIYSYIYRNSQCTFHNYG
ncbi:protein of unknown function [Clostridium beijerinckii]|nr:protein of unknown function [Clostridium beijerinckii]